MFLFTTHLGVGSQFLAIATGILLMAVGGLFNVHQHWTLNSTAVVLYAATSCKSALIPGGDPDGNSRVILSSSCCYGMFVLFWKCTIYWHLLSLIKVLWLKVEQPKMIAKYCRQILYFSHDDLYMYDTHRDHSLASKWCMFSLLSPLA